MEFFLGPKSALLRLPLVTQIKCTVSPGRQQEQAWRADFHTELYVSAYVHDDDTEGRQAQWHCEKMAQQRENVGKIQPQHEIILFMWLLLSYSHFTFFLLLVAVIVLLFAWVYLMNSLDNRAHQWQQTNIQTWTQIYVQHDFATFPLAKLSTVVTVIESHKTFLLDYDDVTPLPLFACHIWNTSTQHDKKFQDFRLFEFACVLTTSARHWATRLSVKLFSKRYLDYFTFLFFFLDMNNKNDLTTVEVCVKQERERVKFQQFFHSL